MLNSTQTRSEHLLRNPGLVAAGLGTSALAADFFFGIRESRTRRSHPEFHIARRNRAMGALVAMPGCQTDGKNYFRMIRERARGATVVGVDYPKHGRFVEEEIFEGLANSLIEARAEHASFICQSMSGKAIRGFMRYADQTGVAERLGGFGTIVLDASPYDRDDVRKQYRTLLTTASALHLNWTANHLKRRVSKALHKPGDGAHLDTIHYEGKFMKDTGGLRPLPAIMDRIVYVQSPYDHVINSDQAVAKYEQVTPDGLFTHIVDWSRDAPSHTATDKHLDRLVEVATTGDLAPILHFARKEEPEQEPVFQEQHVA